MSIIYTKSDNTNLSKIERKKKAKKRLKYFEKIIDRWNRKQNEKIEFNYF